MRTTKRKSLLYKSGVEYADFCLNHVEGCAHGCMFPCYAFQMARRFGKVKSHSDWIKPKLVVNALELLDKEIPKYRNKIKFVHLCFMTDPFMYRYKEVGDMTLKIINKLNRNNIRCTVLTKGIYPKSLANKEKYGSNNEYGITLVSLNKEFKEEYERDSAPYSKRIKALKRLHDKGLRTWVSMEPYPPSNLSKQNLLEILKKISFVDKIVFGKLNYNVQSSLANGDNKLFYDKCANHVINFCEKKGIDCHIKFGTKKGYNNKTETLFKNVCKHSNQPTLFREHNKCQTVSPLLNY